MKNYQGVNYRKYYAQDENGNYVEVDRKSCFARGETPSTANPLKQRWFYDEEAGYVVRLSRTIESEDIHRFISSDLKKDERYRDERFKCVWKEKETAKCDQDCAKCKRTNTSRTVELDRSCASDDGEMQSFFTPVDDSQDILNILEDKELIELLLPALESLSDEDKLLFSCLIEKKKKKVVAKLLNITVDGVRYRELRLRKKLLTYEDLKKFLEK